MLGRAAYHDPYLLAEAEARRLRRSGDAARRAPRCSPRSCHTRGVSWRKASRCASIARHVLGSLPRCRRRPAIPAILSDAARLRAGDAAMFDEARRTVETEDSPRSSARAASDRSEPRHVVGDVGAMMLRSRHRHACQARYRRRARSSRARSATMASITGSRRQWTRARSRVPATARSASTISATLTQIPGTLTERVCANAFAGASCPAIRLSMTAARRGEPHPRRRRHRAVDVDARKWLADDAARERRGGAIGLARPHDDRRQAQASPVEIALARHVVDQQFADRLLRAVGRLRRQCAHRRVPGRAARRRTPRASSRRRASAVAASARQRSSSRRVASRLARMPMSKSASACPLTTAARWNTDSTPPVKRRCDRRRIGEVSELHPHARVVDRYHRGDGVDQHDLTDLARCAATLGQRAAPEQTPREPRAEKAGAAGDDDAHGAIIASTAAAPANGNIKLQNVFRRSFVPTSLRSARRAGLANDRMGCAAPPDDRDA